MKIKGDKRVIILIFSVAIIIFILCFTRGIALWFNGISYIANNTKQYSDEEGHTIGNEYQISINLYDLESNIGKELYNDGESKIYVSWIDNTGSSNSGGYRIGFRSCGIYSLNGATLVSGVCHENVDNNSFRTYMSAKMTAKYKDNIYNSSVLGTSGLNYKDGDEFAFYIFPSEAYDKENVSLDEDGIVKLSIKNLYKNIWTKK